MWINAEYLASLASPEVWICPEGQKDSETHYEFLLKVKRTTFNFLFILVFKIPWPLPSLKLQFPESLASEKI